MNRSTLSFLLLISVFSIQPLNAYIDPGTGSTIIQLLIAGSVTILYTTKVYWKSIRSFFSRKKDCKK